MIPRGLARQRFALVFGALLISLSPGASSAQLASGTLLEDGRVAVKIFVTMPDSAITAGHPISDVRLLLASPSDRFTVTTDGAGTALAFVPPGAYRVATLDEVEWRGKRFRWDVAVTVRPGMGIVDLTPLNGMNVGPTLAATARPSNPDFRTPAARPSNPDFQTPAAPRPAAFGAKNPGTAQLWSFLIIGAGQVYAGEAGKGLTLFVLGNALLGASIAQATSDAACDAYYSDCDDSGSAALLAVGALGLWVYSIADADDSVRRYNERHGFVARTAPVFAVRHDHALVGVALAF